MKKTYFLIALSVVVVLNVPYSRCGATMITALGLWKTRRLLWIIVLLSVILHPHLKTDLPRIRDGVVSELNDRSALVTAGKHQVLITSIETLWVGDRLVITDITPIEVSSAPRDRGWMAYVHLQGLVGTASGEAVVSIDRSMVMQWLIDQWSINEDFLSLVRKLLFQSDPLGEWGLIAGTGLIFLLIHRILGSLLSGFLRESVNSALRLVLWISLAAFLGYPLGLLRFVISLVTGGLIKDRWKRWTSQVAVFWLLDPSLLTSMTLLIPLFFQAFELFKRDVNVRSVSFTLFQGLMWHRVSPLITLGYPIWRRVMTIMVLTVWLATLFTSFQPLVVHGVRVIASIMHSLADFWVIRGQLTLPLLAALFLAWLVAKWTPRLRAAWLLAVTVYLPGLSAPWLPTVTVIDVGQGNAIVINSPLNRSVVLVDTGRSYAFNEVKATLDRMGIATLDALILTHDDADHTGNTKALSEAYQVKSLITTSHDVALKDLVLVALEASVRLPNDNQKSLVYGLKVGSTRFVLTGDADMINEGALMSRYPDLKTDVLLVGHHGSAGSTSTEWLGTLQPRLAIISVGDNTYGHPSPAVVDRLQAFHIPFYTTQDEGNIRFIMTPWITILTTDSRKLKVLR